MAETRADWKIRRRIQALIKDELQKAYPYLKTGAIDEASDGCGKIVKRLMVAQKPVMVASKERSGFMSLSAELRNRIYDLILTPVPGGKDEEHYEWLDGKPGLVLQSREADKYGWDEDNESEWWLQPAITKVSRQVRSETLPMYYGMVEFRMYAGSDVGQISSGFRRLRHMQKHAHLIKHLHFLFEDDYLQDTLKASTLSCFEGPYAEEKGVPPSSVKVKVLIPDVFRYSSEPEYVEL